MRIATLSIGCENLAKHNVAKPNGWKFFTIEDRIRINEWNPDMIVCLGWFCKGFADWQVHRAAFGDTRKVIIHWVGTDILAIKDSYKRGHKGILEWLRSDRFLHVAPTKESFKEMEWTGFKMYGPVDVPAERLISIQPMPDKIRLAVYMPSDRQHFYGIELMKSVLPIFKDEIDVVFYHWLHKIQSIEYPRSHEEFYAMSRDEYEDKILGGCSALVRIPVHDAGSISVGEFFMAGKPIISNQNLPLWPYGVKGSLYSKYQGDYRLVDGAEKKLEAEVRRILDLLKNSKQPVSDKIVEAYRRAYDPAMYVEKLSEYTNDYWGVSIEPTIGEDRNSVCV